MSRFPKRTFAAAAALSLWSTAAAWPVPGAAAGTLQAVEAPGGGHILAGTLGSQPSLGAATLAVLRRIHAEFGARPVVLQVAQNASAHSVALFFSESRGGRRYTGMSLVTATPGAQPGAAVLYDTSARFPSSVGGMLRRLRAMTERPAQSAGSGVPAPAEPLIRHAFSDGTGNIAVPADWKLTTAGGGSASALGPTGEIVSYNMVVNAMDPGNRTAVNYLNGLPPQFRQAELGRTAMLSYSGDPREAWTHIFRQLASQNGRPSPSFTVDTVKDLSTPNGVRLAQLTGTGTIPRIPGKSDAEPGTYFAFVQVTPPNTMGQWSMYSTWTFVPQSRLLSQAATAEAVMASVRIDFQAVAAQAEATRAFFRQQFDAMIARARAGDAERQAQSDRFMANDRAAQEGMHRQAVAMENYALDRMVVENTTTGRHTTLDSDFAGALVQNDRDYRRVAPSELIGGVDY